MARRWRTALCVVLAVAPLGLAACDDEETPVVSEDAFQEEVARLCERHIPRIQSEYDRATRDGLSDAEEAGVYRSALVPRMLALLREINDFGIPAAQTLEIRTAMNTAAAALDEIDEDAPALIDRRRDGNLPDDENPFLELQSALVDGGFGCAVPASGWELRTDTG